MINTVFGIKQNQTQAWDSAGNRLSLTIISVDPHSISQIKTEATDGYNAVQVAFGSQKPQRINKPLKQHIKKAGIELNHRHIKEVRLTAAPEETLKPSQVLSVDQILKIGDVVKVTGNTKGHGFTGVVKRWGFSGGPRTHGQSDRLRAPGSIGQGTDPGRVWKGKKMAGRHGNTQMSVKNLVVVKIDGQSVWLNGTVPGHRQSLVRLTKTGETTFVGFPEVKTDKPEEVASTVTTLTSAPETEVNTEASQKSTQKEE